MVSTLIKLYFQLSIYFGKISFYSGSNNFFNVHLKRYRSSANGANTSNIWSPKETVIAIIMVYKNTKAMVCSPNNEIDFFDIVTEDILASYLFIIYLDYILQMSIDLMKENSFTVKKARSRW